MKDFGDLGIVHEKKGFRGQKVGIQSILNLNLIIEDWKKEPSTIKGKDIRLDLQIKLNGEQRITWTSSKNLIAIMEKIPRTSLPFSAKIVAIDGGGFKFAPADK